MRGALGVAFGILAALACLSAGYELGLRSGQQIVPPLLEPCAPASRVGIQWIAACGHGMAAEQLRRVLDVAPSVVLGLAALAAGALARRGRGVRERGSAPRSVLCGVALLVAGAGLALSGTDLAHGAVRSLAQHWPGAPAALEPVLVLPAWSLALAGALGVGLAWPRAGAPARPPHAIPHAARLRRLDLRRTLAYLESQREWPRGSRDRDE